MKKFFTLFLFTLGVKFSFAQKLWDREFKPFKMDFTAGYAMPKGANAKGGALFSIEPHYAFTGDAFTFGLRLEGAALVVGTPEKTADTIGINPEETNTHLSAVLTCDHYFSNSRMRPFIGAGPGLFSVAVETGKQEGALLPSYDVTNKFGFMFRGGAEWGHFRASLEYNLISQSPVSESINGYLGIKIGVFLGGGRFDLISGNRSPY